ncbi:MAG: four helix bundle protein [bacterium]
MLQPLIMEIQTANGSTSLPSQPSRALPRDYKLQNNCEEIQTSNCKLQNNSQARKDQKPKVYDIRERLFIFSKRILEICKKLPQRPEAEIIRKQLARAGTSIGANYEEADGALTKKDFINKVCIARKEAKETRYWLRIVNTSFIAENRLDFDIDEIEQITSILSAIIIKCGGRTSR